MAPPGVRRKSEGSPLNDSRRATVAQGLSCRAVYRNSLGRRDMPTAMLVLVPAEEIPRDLQDDHCQAEGTETRGGRQSADRWLDHWTT